PKSQPAKKPSEKPKTTPTRKPTEKPKPKPKPTKVKVVPYAATGTVTAVDAAGSTITLQVKGGKDKHNTSVTVAVASTARIRLNDKAVTLATLPVGAKVAVSGTSAGGVVTVTRVNANARTVKPSPAPSRRPS